MFSQDSSQDFFAHLPLEICFEIFSYLNLEAIAELRCINQKFHVSLADNLVWKALFHVNFPHLRYTIEDDAKTNWYAESRKAYLSEYGEGFTERLCKVFSFAKIGDIESLKAIFQLDDLTKFDTSKFSLIDWANEKNNQELLDFFYGQLEKTTKSSFRLGWRTHGLLYDLKTLKRTPNNQTLIDIFYKKIKESTGNVFILRDSPLYWAIWCRQSKETIESLLHSAKAITFQMINTACEVGQLDVVKLLIKKAPTSINQPNALKTLLTSACLHGHTKVVELLIEKKATPNLHNLWDACTRGYLGIVKLLIEKDPDLLNEAKDYSLILYGLEDKTPVYCAVIYGHMDIVDYLVQQGAKLDWAHPKNGTALHHSVKSGHRSTVKHLLAKQPNLCDATDIFGKTPLRYAVKKGHTEIVKDLLENNASINGEDFDAACVKGNFEILKLLITKRPDLLNETDRLGRTTLHYAAKSGNKEVVNFLAQQGAKLNQQDKNGDTPLHLASRNQHTNTVKVLLTNRAHVLVYNKLGKTPASVALLPLPLPSEHSLKLRSIEDKLKINRQRLDDYTSWLNKGCALISYGFSLGQFSLGYKKQALAEEIKAELNKSEYLDKNALLQRNNTLVRQEYACSRFFKSIYGKTSDDDSPILNEGELAKILNSMQCEDNRI